MSSSRAARPSPSPPAPAAHLTSQQRSALLRDTPPLTAQPAPQPRVAALSSAQLPASSSSSSSAASSSSSSSSRVILPRRIKAKPLSAPVAVAAAADSSGHSEAAAAAAQQSNGTQTMTSAARQPSVSARSPAAPSGFATSSLLSSSSGSSTPASPPDSSAQSASPASLSSSLRVAAHQQALLDALRELVRQQGVGHWQGLSTQQRKDTALALCREHLFNPQPGKARDSRTEVSWSATSSWTDFDVWVQCTRTTLPYYTGTVHITVYTAHFDQVGRLVEFEEKDSTAQKNCAIQ